MEKLTLYHCCNTCANKDSSFYGCRKSDKCFNGFTAYTPNEEMKKQEQLKLTEE